MQTIQTHVTGLEERPRQRKECEDCQKLQAAGLASISDPLTSHAKPDTNATFFSELITVVQHSSLLIARPDSDIDHEDSHVRSQTRDQAVKDKRRSPPSNRSPSAPKRNPHHSGQADQQESPERVVQKEKLHAELKQVLSQKRSHLRELDCKLAQSEMDSKPAEEQSSIEEISKSVEIVVETEADAGASGYSVTGGGQHGIFVKDVLKDSPAAKHLSLQQGDQLLSAKVYFDNVRYEDALKILQCAEPYKVSFLVKRSVPKAEVRPSVPSVEVKGPKAKMAKMSVKGIKPFKTQKKRGGRFGLRRLKEKRKGELVIEGTPPGLEPDEVDVEFSLPKLKQKKSGRSDVAVEGTKSVGKPKGNIRFPHLKAKGSSRAEQKLGGHENIPPSEISGAKGKSKGKAHKFGIIFPKTKHTKSGSGFESGSVEFKPPEISLRPPSVEVGLSGKTDKIMEKRGSKFNPPDVEFALPSGKVEASLPTVKGTDETKAPKIDIVREADVLEGKVNIDEGKEDVKLRMPKLKLPKIRLSRHSDVIDGEVRVKAEGIKISNADIKTETGEIRGDGDGSLPQVEVTKPKIKTDKSGLSASVQMPSVGFSLPKVKEKSDASYSMKGFLGADESEINMPAVKISVPDAALQSDSECRIPDEIDGAVKGLKISVVDISSPNTRAPGVKIEGTGEKEKFNPSSVDVSLAKIKSDGIDVDMDHYVGVDGKFKLPDFDITPPKMKSPEKEGSEVGFKLPNLDLTLPESNAGITNSKVIGKCQIPSFDVSVPKLKAGVAEVATKGLTVKDDKTKLPVMSSPEGKIEGDVCVKGNVERDKFKMPSIELSLPKLKPKTQINAPNHKVEGEIPVPCVNIYMPTRKTEGDIKTKIKGEKSEVSLSKPKGELDIEGGVEGGKFNMPSVNISLPKMKLVEGDVKLAAPEIPKDNLSLPTAKAQENLELEGKGGTQFKKPTFDISFPTGKTEEVDIKDLAFKRGAKFNMPSLDISLTTTKSPEGGTDFNIDGSDINIKPPKAIVNLKGTEIKEGKMNLPKKDISLAKGNLECKINVEGEEQKMPSFNVSLPKVKMPKEKIETGEQSVDVSMPKGKLDVNIGPKGKGGHFHLPSVDVFLPKIKSKRGDANTEGPEMKSGEVKPPTIDISPPQVTLEGGIGFDDNGKEFGSIVPCIDVNSPSIKIPEKDIHFQGPKVKEGKFEMPRIDLSLPKGEKHANIDIDIHSGIDGKFEIPSYNAKLPKGQGESDVNVKTPKEKSGKLKMPKLKVSAPKLDTPDFEIKVQEPEDKGRKEIPNVDISIPKLRIEGDLGTGSHGNKGGKFHIPSLNVNLPKINSKEAGTAVKEHEVTFDVSVPKKEFPELDIMLEGPDVDISLPKPKADFKLDVKDADIKGENLKTPTFDISMPKVNFPEGEIMLKGPDFKAKKIEMPDIDISVPKGKSDREINGHGRKGGKFHIPSVNFSLPRIKAKGPDVSIEGPKLDQGDINMPDFDGSYSKENADIDLKFESTEVKEGKFKIPIFGISLPKANQTEGYADKPKGNISLPKVKEDIDFEGHMDKNAKFQVPSTNVSLPKIKAKGADINLEGPDMKGDVILPKVEGDLSLMGSDVKGAIFNLPTVDISFLKGQADGHFAVESSENKTGQFKMPKFDASLPELSLPEGDIRKKDLSNKAKKTENPNLDILIPKGKAKGEIEIDGHASKDSKFQLPTVGISLPRIQVKKPDSGGKLPESQVGITQPDVTVPKLKFPELDVSVQGTDVNVDVSPSSFKMEGDVNAEEINVKGGVFKMPKFDVSLPKISLPKVDSSIERPSAKIKGKTNIYAGDISIPKPKRPEVNIEGADGGKINIPYPDASLDKAQSPDIDVSFKGVELMGEKIKMPTHLKGKTGIDFNDEATVIKGGKFKLPTLDISLPKVSLPKTDVSVEGPDMKGAMEVPVSDFSHSKAKTDIEIDTGNGKNSKFHTPSVDITLPSIKAKETDVDIHEPKIKGDFSLTNIKSLDTDITIKGPKIEGAKTNISNVDVSLFKGKMEGSINTEGTEKKGGKFKMPKFDVSLPKINTKVDANAEGPDINKTVQKPTTDISLPEINVKNGKGSKFHMPRVDFSLPKVKVKGPDIEIPKPDIKVDLSTLKEKCPEVDISISEPDVEGGTVDQPILDISYPKGEHACGLDISGPERKGVKLKMPKIDMPLPTVSVPEDNLKIKVLELKKGKIELPDIDLSLPKGKAGEFAAKGHTGKTGIFHMPNIDISIPKIKSKATEMHIEGPEFKGKKLNIPETNISLPKEHIDADLGIEGPELTGGVNMPKVDVSLPRLSLPEGAGNVKGPNVEGKVEIPSSDISTLKGEIKEGIAIEGRSGTKGKFQLPSIDISLPKLKSKRVDVDNTFSDAKYEISFQSGQLKSELNVEELQIKGSKLKIPTFDVSVPKVNHQEGELKIKGPEIRRGDIEIKDGNISLPKGKTGKIETELPYKESKFHMPSIDITLPTIKAKGPDVNLEIPEIEGGKVKMPNVGASLNTGKTDIDVDVEVAEIKGERFKLPKFDVSFPKVSLPKTDVSVEGPVMNGETEVPTADISLPKAKTDVEIDVQTTTSSKFHMPSIDLSLPKFKAKGDLDIQGPKIKGDLLLPKVKSPEVGVSPKTLEIEGGNLNLPTIDTSPPKGKDDGDHKGEWGKFKMPKIDVSLPKLSLPEGGVKMKSPDMKAGKIEMPDIDLSLPKPMAEGQIDTNRHSAKGSKFYIPSIPLHGIKAIKPQANIKDPEVDVDVKNPDIKGGNAGRFHMPSLDIHMPKFDLDLTLSSSSNDKGLKTDISGSDGSGDLKMLGLKSDQKKDKVKVNTEYVESPGATLKLPSVKLPTVDISAPNVDLDFGLNKPKSDDVKVELLKAEDGRPSSGGSFVLPDMSLKVHSFTFPRFGAKSKSRDFEVLGLQADNSLPNVEGEIREPSVEFDRDGKVKMKKPKIKKPYFGVSKKDTNTSVSCPDVDVKMKKGKADIPQLDVRTESSHNKVKHKVKFPKFKMSSPKVNLPEGEDDVKVESDSDRMSGFHAPDVTLKLPKFSIPRFSSKENNFRKPSDELQAQSKVRMPSVELSLPEAKTREIEMLLPKAEVDVSEADIKRYEGNLKIPKIPKIDVSIPKVDLDVLLPKGKSQNIKGPDRDLKGGEGKLNMPQITIPTLDVNLPKEKPKDINAPKTKIEGDGCMLKTPYVKIPTVDISLPKTDISLSKAKSEAPETEMEGTLRQKFKMPRVDISLPKGKLQHNKAPEIHGKREEIKLPHIKIPNVDISLPKGKIDETDGEIREEGGNITMPQVSMPSGTVSLSKGTTEDSNVQVEGASGAKFKLPHSKVSDDVYLSNRQIHSPDLEIKDEKGKFKMPQMSMPSVEISLTKSKVEGSDAESIGEAKSKTQHFKIPLVNKLVTKGKTDPDAEITGKMIEKSKVPHVKMPNVDFSFHKGEHSPDLETKGEGGKLRPHSGPSVDISLPKEKNQSPEMRPNVEISLLKSNAGNFEKKEFKTEGTIPEVPSGDISRSKGKIAGLNSGIKSEGGRFMIPKVDISLPKVKPSVEPPDVDLKKDKEQLNTETSKEDIELDIGYQREECRVDKKKVVLPDLDLDTVTNSKGKRGKGKGTKFKIGGFKSKGVEDVTTEEKQSGDYNVRKNGHATDKGYINITAPEVTLPDVSLKTSEGCKGGQSSSKRVPKIPDIEFDIGTSQDEDDDKTNTERKVKIPKFGVPLPSISSPDKRTDISGPEVRYEGPKMPKVKKAVFVLVNSNETEQESSITTTQKTAAENEAEDVKVNIPKMKSGFGKPKDKPTEREAEEKEKSLGAKIKMPKGSSLLGQSGSAGVVLKGDSSSSSLSGTKDGTPPHDSKNEKRAFGGKMKFPKVEFSSPYVKLAKGDKMGKDTLSGEVERETQGPETTDKIASKEVVSSHARTEMLDRDSSESSVGFSTEFSSTRVQTWTGVESRNKEVEEKEPSSWFKVPKFTLKPHATEKVSFHS